MKAREERNAVHAETREAERRRKHALERELEGVKETHWGRPLSLDGRREVQRLVGHQLECVLSRVGELSGEGDEESPAHILTQAIEDLSRHGDMPKVGKWLNQDMGQGAQQSRGPKGQGQNA